MNDKYLGRRLLSSKHRQTNKHTHAHHTQVLYVVH